MNNSQKFYAHSNGQNKEDWQYLIDHLVNAANLADELGKDTGLSAYAKTAALFHDIGKYSARFQQRLSGSTIRVDHSTAGAQEIKRIFADKNQPILGTILAYCIAGHHGGLPDYGSVIDGEYEGTLQGRLKRSLEDYSLYASEIDLIHPSFPANPKVRPSTKTGGFSFAFFTRMIYSILVDADFLETETFINGGRKPRGEYDSIPCLTDRLNTYLKKYEGLEEPINQQRTKTLKACIEQASHKPGLFTLTVPTGGGKTFSSLAFALNHARIHDLKRIIYVIPYTSIIEQNAGKFKEALGLENVLEHHSNFDWEAGTDADDSVSADEQTNTITGKLKLASENWDIPVVVTTNVQFFESLFSNRSSKCRKIHNLAKSVMIFDETQMFPRDFMKPALMAVHELVQNYGSTAVFCTATQPVVQRFLPSYATCQELAPEPKALYDFYKRVQVRNIGKVSDEDLIQKLNAQSQVLCIVNTRKHAKGLFQGLEDPGRFHLSTLMCAAHRKAVIDEIRKSLAADKVCRVVSTQIMEAGIDVDFPVGYRAFSGLDSIIQAAGRVNRENKHGIGDLFVFEPDSKFVGRTPAYIAQGAEIARGVLRTYQEKDPVSLEAIQDYYESLYGLLDKNAFDRREIMDCFEKPGANDAVFDFATAGSRFKIIEDATIPVVISFNETANELVSQLGKGGKNGQLKRRLQPFTVNIYQNEFTELLKQGVITTYDEVFHVLNNMKLYDCQTGLVIGQTIPAEAIFFDG
ncbi:MAG: CRISPR-associated helicase Cas3' [Anaerolineaceae bacterium]